MSSYDFQLVSDFQTAVSSYPNCQINTIWNAWFCADPYQVDVPQVGTLVFESLDEDTEDRSVQPVVITNADGYKNVINSMMDHTWDGFYTGQKRLSRFPAQILTGKAYTLTYTGTPFKNGRYTLKADAGTNGILVKIPYPNAGAYSVKVNGVIIPYQSIDPATSQPAEINVNTASCGANRFIGVQNYLEFFITPGCELIVNPRDAILTSVRLSWTAAEFFADGGVTTFTQRLGAVLGIDPTRVKVVAIYEGSLNIITQILALEATIVTLANGAVQASQTAFSELTNINSQLVVKLRNAAPSVLGASVLQVQSQTSTQFVQNTVVSNGGGGGGSYTIYDNNDPY